MSLLFQHLRIHQIFGANTDVGKTILASALVRASASKKKPVFYLKPVSTGPEQNADDEHVKRHAGAAKDLVHTNCLYRFQEPVSPHLAARRVCDSGVNKIPSDEMLVNTIAKDIRRCAARSMQSAHMYVETAGGVHSPTPSGTTQLDSYRPLFLPTVLVGDSRLGGISSTISSYESLLLRGFIVDAIMLFRDSYYRNWEYLNPYFAERGVHVSAVESPPAIIANALENFASMEKYYEKLLSLEEGGIFDILEHLDSCHTCRLEELDSMPRRTLDSVWWPFVQHGLVQDEKDVTVIDSAWSDFFSIHNPSAAMSHTEPSGGISVLEPQFDGSASWWTQALGHAHPALTLAAARASGRYGHVMFPQATHLPALKLAEHLVQDGPGKGWAARAFFSDDGSTGMEIALKMALRAFSLRERENIKGVDQKHLGVLGLRGSYHGDTIGAMDACEEGVYTCEWHNARGYWFEPPTISIQKGTVIATLPSCIITTAESSEVNLEFESLAQAYDVATRLHSPLAQIYHNYVKRTIQSLQKCDGPKIAALVLEPLVMGAGGMIFVDPLFQRVMIDAIREPTSLSSHWSGLPVIFDEVFVGLYRVGMQSTASLLGVYPDISVNAKILTGGLVPLAVTLASESIFQAFLSENKQDALLHGHSYSAHPIGCEVANETQKIVQKLVTSDSWKTAQKKWAHPAGEPAVNIWSFWDPAFIQTVSRMSVVAEVMTLGTVLSIKIRDDQAGYVSQSAQTVLQAIKTIADGKSSVSAAPGGAPFSIHFRTLGDVAYFMTSLNTSPSAIRSLEDKIRETLQQSCP